MITSVDQINIFPCHHQVASSKIMKITNNKLYGKIDRLNIEHGMVNYLGVHKHGIRVVTRKWQDLHGQLQREHQHRWEQWREKVRSNMLHLTNDRRFVLGKAVNEFFINRT